MTEFPEAREAKIDSTFFPPLSGAEIDSWEASNDLSLPEALRSFYLQSDGMEAQKGILIPVLGLQKCVVMPAGCRLEKPWIRFAAIESWFYFYNLATDSIFRVEEFGSSEPEFFARSLTEYFEKVFRARW